MRVNLTRLQDQIDGYLMDLENLDQDRPKGYRAEIKAIEKEVATLRGVRDRGIRFGTGYYDYEVANKGRNLVLAVAFILLTILLSGWLAVLFSGG
jgi:hypothetical protein